MLQAPESKLFTSGSGDAWANIRFIGPDAAAVAAGDDSERSWEDVRADDGNATAAEDESDDGNVVVAAVAIIFLVVVVMTIVAVVEAL